jgi:CBS domain-containing protein
MYEFLDYKAQDVMARDPVTIAPEATLGELVECFAAHGFNGLPVVDHSGGFVGMVTKLDLLQAFGFDDEHMFPPYDEIMKRPVSGIMTRDVQIVWPRTPLHKVLQKMLTLGCKSLPVLDDYRLVGVVAREDVMRGLYEAHGRRAGTEANDPGDEVRRR